jgi:hypothetical protein
MQWPAKVFSILSLCVVFCAPCLAQAAASPTSSAPASAPAPTVQNIYAAGVSYNNAAQPAVAGTALYARLVAGTNTYAFTAVDLLPTSTKPLTVDTGISVGIAEQVFSIGKVPIFVPTSAGVSFTGSNTGWEWTTGALASIKLKGNWRIFPMARVGESSVSNHSGIEPIVGVLIGWGQ